MKKDLENTLLFIVNLLNKSKVNYFLTGSLCMYLHGCKINPTDVDIHIFYKDFKKVNNLLLDSGKIQVKSRSTTKEYKRMIFNLLGSEVDLMGFKNIGYSKLPYSILSEKKDKTKIVVKKTEIIVPNIEYLLKLYSCYYERWKRPKHLKKLKLLEKLTKKGYTLPK
jgi:hypothetical protein